MESKQISVSITDYEKVVKKHVIINIPLKPVYLREHNNRTVIGIFPQFLNNEVWELKLFKITDNKIIKDYIRTDKDSLSNVLSSSLKQNPNRYFISSVIQYLRVPSQCEFATEELYKAKLQAFIENAKSNC